MFLSPAVPSNGETLANGNAPNSSSLSVEVNGAAWNQNNQLADLSLHSPSVGPPSNYLPMANAPRSSRPSFPPYWSTANMSPNLQRSDQRSYNLPSPISAQNPLPQAPSVSLHVTSAAVSSSSISHTNNAVLNPSPATHGSEAEQSPQVMMEQQRQIAIQQQQLQQQALRQQNPQQQAQAIHQQHQIQYQAQRQPIPQQQVQATPQQRHLAAQLDFQRQQYMNQRQSQAQHLMISQAQQSQFQDYSQQQPNLQQLPNSQQQQHQQTVEETHQGLVSQQQAALQHGIGMPQNQGFGMRQQQGPYHEQQQLLQLQQAGQQHIPPRTHQYQLQNQALHHVALPQQIPLISQGQQLRTASHRSSNSRRTSTMGHGRQSVNAYAPGSGDPLELTGQSKDQTDLQVYGRKVHDHDINRPLIPPRGFVHPAQPVQPERTALHQAHLRSPHLVPSDTLPPNSDGSRSYFQVVGGFVMKPIDLGSANGVLRSSFTISERDYPNIAEDKFRSTDRLPDREFKCGSLQYRIKCVQTTTALSEENWYVSDTSWPESIFIEFNDKQLEIRRKIHHGKDLPIDITRNIVPMTANPRSANRIAISAPRSDQQQKQSRFFIAIEVVTIMDNTEIMEMCLQQRIPTSDTLENIKKSLNSQDDDDDFAMVVSDLSLDLADPFTARIFDIPVRGKFCLHRECFDLQTFLITRNSKPKRPKQPSMIDVWKCPLCGKDARPHSLRLVDFLWDVRRQLGEQDNLDVKAILISADGSWRPKPEPQVLKRKASKDLNDDSSEDEGAHLQGPSSGFGTTAVKLKNGAHKQSGAHISREIIELDD